MFTVVESDSESWEAIYEEISANSRDIFHNPRFAKAYAETIRPKEGIAAAVFRSGQTAILYPFVHRVVDRVIGKSGIAEGYIDLVSMYGRCGAIGKNFDENSIVAFNAEFAGWCREQKIICGFDRFHPVLENHKLVSPYTEVIEVGEFVVVDLRPSIEKIESNFRYSMRKAINKGYRAGVTVETSENIDQLNAFIDIYHQTLDKNIAKPFYYFPNSFYKILAREFSGHFVFYYGLIDGEIVTCELVLLSQKFAHSYLGGSCPKGLSASANQILKREIIRDLKRRGCQYFLLGGGQNPNDGVYRYKLAYAPYGARRSFVGGTIFLPDNYSALRTSMLKNKDPMALNRFQFYDIG